MAATTTFPAILPDRASVKTVTPRVLRADFGDNYLQATPDGINPFTETWDLSFENYLETDITTITDFLDARGGYDPFFWTPPGETPLSPVKQWIQVEAYTHEFTAFQTGFLAFSIMRIYQL